MSVDKSEKIRQLYQGVWSGEDLSVADDIIAEDYEFHHPDFDQDVSGPERIKENAREMLEAFPDMETAINDLIVSGDKVIVRWTMTRTHEGAMEDEEPTGNEVELKGIEINRFNDRGEIVEHWAQSDVHGLEKQIGLI